MGKLFKKHVAPPQAAAVGMIMENSGGLERQLFLPPLPSFPFCKNVPNKWAGWKDNLFYPPTPSLLSHFAKMFPTNGRVGKTTFFTPLPPIPFCKKVSNPF